MNKYARIDWTKLKPQPVIGVDEVGRGCLAGPVFAGAVLFINRSGWQTPEGCPEKNPQKGHTLLFPRNGQPIPRPQSQFGLKISTFFSQKEEEHYPDSKQITPEERKKLAQIIMHRHIYAIGISSVEEIAKLNILQASLLAMNRAVIDCYAKWQALLPRDGSQGHADGRDVAKQPLSLHKQSQEHAGGHEWGDKLPRKTHILVDGNFLIPDLPSYFHQTAFIKGDQRLSPIASASIIAKVARDDWISRQDTKYPQYGFSRHKGYATLQHRQALIQHGPCPLHRKNFRLNYKQV